MKRIIAILLILAFVGLSYPSDSDAAGFFQGLFRRLFGTGTPSPSNTPNVRLIVVPKLSSVIIGENGTSVSLVFDKAVQVGAGGNTGWTITMSGGAVTMTYASGSGTNTLVYDLNRTVNSGETGTVAYTQPGDGIETY